jgi:hypothetical protein
MNVQTSVRKPSTAWPIQLRWAEVRGQLLEEGIVVLPRSPIFALRPDPEMGKRPRRVGHEPNEADTRKGTSDAIRILAGARQLLALWTGRKSDPAVFFNDGRGVVRLASGCDGITVGRPWTPQAFGQAICRIVHACPGHVPFDDAAATRSFLTVFGALCATGIGTDLDSSLSRPEAEAALQAASAPDAGMRSLDALLQAGLLVAAGKRVFVEPGWAARNAFLMEPPRVKLGAVELTGSDQSRQPPRELTIYGSQSGRLTYDPGTALPEERELVLGLAPVTERLVASSVEQLLSFPISPPPRPIVDYDGDPVDWLGATATPSRWRDDGLAAVVGLRDALAPASMFTPGATVQVSLCRFDGGEPCWKVLGLDGSSAVEWTMDGARVRWRELTHETAGGSLEGLLALIGSQEIPQSIGECTLDRATMRSLLNGEASGQAGRDLPGAITGLASEETVWGVVRCDVGAGEASSSVEVALAVSPSLGAWLFVADGNHYIGRPSGRAELEGVIRQGLAAPLSG